MGCDKDNQGGILDDVFEVRGGDEVAGKGDIGEVPRIEVCPVDDLSQFLAVDLKVSILYVLRHQVRLTCFSRTHMRASEWNSSCRFHAFSAAIFARADPHDPDPMTAILCLPLLSGDGGS